MQLSKNQKNVCRFFAAFLKSSSSLKHFEKKDEGHILCISEIKECEKLGQINVLKAPIKKTLEQSTRNKVLNTARQNFYHFFLNVRETELENLSVSDM